MTAFTPENEPAARGAHDPHENQHGGNLDSGINPSTARIGSRIGQEQEIQWGQQQ